MKRLLMNNGNIVNVRCMDLIDIKLVICCNYKQLFKVNECVYF